MKLSKSRPLPFADGLALPRLAPQLGVQGLMAGLALAVIWPAGQLAAEISRDFLDYLRNPGPAPELQFAAPDRVAVNGVKAPNLPEAAPEVVPEVVVAAAAPEPVPEPAPEPLPEPTALAPTAPPALASTPAPALEPTAPAPVTPLPPEVTLAALPPAVLSPSAPQVLQGEPVVVPEPGSPEALFGPTPQGKDLVRAVQQLLKDQNCYAGAVDGGFGAGSLGSLDLFYDANPGLAREAGATEVAWRALQGEGLTPCKAPYVRPVAAKPAASKPAATASNKPAASKPAAPAAPKPAAPAPSSTGNLAADAN